MTDRILITLSLILLALTNLSFSWPLRNASVTSTFGESRWDHFHDGLDMISESGKIYPVEQGSLLYFWDKAAFPLEEYPCIGNFKVLGHDGGKFSFYIHLDDGHVQKKSYGKDDSLGLVGNTGRSYGRHLHLAIFDSKNRSSVNPLMELPGIADRKEPRIGEMLIKIGDKYITLKNNAQIRLTQHFPLLIKVEDSIRGSERLGVYRLTVYANEKKMADYDFSRVVPSEKGFRISGADYEGIYDQMGYYKVDGIRYQQGKNEFRVIASDFAGNTSEKIYTLNVNLDMK